MAKVISSGLSEAVTYWVSYFKVINWNQDSTVKLTITVKTKIKTGE